MSLLLYAVLHARNEAAGGPLVGGPFLGRVGDLHALGFVDRFDHVASIAEADADVMRGAAEEHERALRVQGLLYADRSRVRLLRRRVSAELNARLGCRPGDEPRTIERARAFRAPNVGGALLRERDVRKVAGPRAGGGVADRGARAAVPARRRSAAPRRSIHRSRAASPRSGELALEERCEEDEE